MRIFPKLYDSKQSTGSFLHRKLVVGVSIMYVKMVSMHIFVIPLATFLNLLIYKCLFLHHPRRFEERQAQLQADKSKYNDGFWNVNTILLGGLGKEPDVDGKYLNFYEESLTFATQKVVFNTTSK